MSDRAVTGSTFKAWLVGGGLFTGFAALIVGLIFLGLSSYLAIDFAKNNAVRNAHQEMLLLRKSMDRAGNTDFLKEKMELDFSGATPTRIVVVVNQTGKQRPMVPELDSWIKAHLGEVKALPIHKEKNWWLDNTGAEKTLLFRANWLLLGSSLDRENMGFIAYNLTGETAFARLILSLALCFIPVILITSMLAGWLSFRRSESHLNNINLFLDKVSDTRSLDLRYSTTVSPEFSSLSRHINAMLGRLSRTLSGIEKATTELAHDLRTPLARASLMLRNRAEKEDDPRMVDMSNEIEKLAQTFETLTGIAKLDANENPPVQSVCLDELLQASLDLFSASFEERDIQVSAKIRADTFVETDPQLSQRVLINLLDNAAKYTKRNGEVQICLEKTDKFYQVTFQNSPANTVTEAEQSHLGEKFFRSDSADNSNITGYGLGLSFVRAAMRNLSGSATWLVKGDTFLVTLRWPAK